MQIRFHKNFKKKCAKLRVAQKKKFKERRDIFLDNPFNPLLHNHLLQGKFTGYRSINITGNLRALYTLTNNGMIIFVDIDTHSNLYT